MIGLLIPQGRSVYRDEVGYVARCQPAGAGSVGRGAKKRMMSSAAVEDSIIDPTWGRCAAAGLDECGGAGVPATEHVQQSTLTTECVDGAIACTQRDPDP
ncbi:hypothetical protein GCM10027280_27880 [Micromonospora polyrhachis]